MFLLCMLISKSLYQLYLYLLYMFDRYIKFNNIYKVLGRLHGIKWASNTCFLNYHKQKV